jgi:hypothetical protein
MGGVGDFLFGSEGDPGESESGNHAWDVLRGSLTPAVGYLTGGGNMLGNLLGVGGGPAQTDALNNFSNSGGMQFLQEQGMKGVTSSKAAQGLLKSGSYGTALSKYNQGLASTYLNSYMDKLLGYSQLGLGAANTLAGAGQYSTGTTATQGKQGSLPSLLQAGAMIAGVSDIRLKSNVVKIGQASDGLGVYRYDLDGQRHTGVMAHEVKQLRPQAYLPKFFGDYDGVDYGKLGSLN